MPGVNHAYETGITQHIHIFSLIVARMLDPLQIHAISALYILSLSSLLVTSNLTVLNSLYVSDAFSNLLELTVVASTSAL